MKSQFLDRSCFRFNIGYGCECDKGYTGDYCTSTHLLPFEILLIVAATATVVGMGVFMGVIRLKYVLALFSEITNHRFSKYQVLCNNTNYCSLMPHKKRCTNAVYLQCTMQCTRQCRIALC